MLCGFARGRLVPYRSIAFRCLALLAGGHWSACSSMATAVLGKRFHLEHGRVRSASISLGSSLAFPVGVLGARITLLADVELC